MQKLSKKGQSFSLQSIIIGLVVVAVIVGAGFLITGELFTEVTTQGNEDAIDGVNKTIQAMKKIPAFLGIIVLVAVLVIVIGYLGVLQPRGRTSDF